MVHREHVPGDRMAWRFGAKDKGSCTGCCCGPVPLSIEKLHCWNGSALLIRRATCSSFQVHEEVVDLVVEVLQLERSEVLLAEIQ